MIARHAWDVVAEGAKVIEPGGRKGKAS
jgi:hypothetical protein